MNIWGIVEIPMDSTMAVTQVTDADIQEALTTSVDPDWVLEVHEQVMKAGSLN